jgi:uroporphyrinogen decarboxylase
MIEGRGSKNWDLARRMMHESPVLFRALLLRIEDCLKPLVTALVEAGCDAIQVFDSWASVLGTEDYATLCAPHSDALLRTAREAGAVAINYVNGAAQHLDAMSRSAGHVLGVDWRLPMAEIRSRVPDRLALQGNLDPTALFLPEDRLRARVREICSAAGTTSHVFNLGHGILPQTDPDILRVVVDEVRKTP